MDSNSIDRISDIPDPILTKILSLIPTRNSVETSVLSTRWKTLYAFVPVLHFQSKKNPDPDFPDFVTKILNDVTQNLSSISEFSVCYRSLVEVSDITSWVEKAVLHSVQVLDVDGCVQMTETGTPHCLFTSEDLVSLTLKLPLRLSVPDGVILPRLKELFLRYIVLSNEADDESVKRLFSSCSVLEELTLEYWELGNSKVFDVSSPSLKVLNISWFERFGSKLLINCPNLEILECSLYGMGGYSGDVLESLKECRLILELSILEMIEGSVIDLIKQVCKVQFLTLAGNIMQALLHPHFSLPTFENLTHLELESTSSQGWQLLASILEHSPCLETLVLISGFTGSDDYEVAPFSPPKHVSACITNHLKVIKNSYFRGEEDEYKLVEYFLANALVLEKMEICIWPSKMEDDSYVEGEGKRGEKAEGEDEDEGEGEDKGDGEEKLQQESEWHLEITRQLLTLRRFSEVGHIEIREPVW